VPPEGPARGSRLAGRVSVRVSEFVGGTRKAKSVGRGCERAASRDMLGAHATTTAHVGRVSLVAHATAHGHACRPPLNAYGVETLQDSAPPRPFAEVEIRLREELGANFLHEIFTEFDTHPIASASIGQVHVARLRSGEKGRRQGSVSRHRDHRVH
jgi:hypothetical protein